MVGSGCVSYPIEARWIDILRHGAVCAEDDAAGACLVQDGADFCLHLFFRPAIEDAIGIVVKAADHAAMVKDLLAFFHRHAFEKGSPVDGFGRIVLVPAKVIVAAHIAANMKKVVVGHRIRRLKDSDLGWRDDVRNLPVHDRPVCNQEPPVQVLS